MFSPGCAVCLHLFPLLLHSAAAKRLSEGTRSCPAFFRLSRLSSLGSARRMRQQSPSSGAASGWGRCRLDTERTGEHGCRRDSRGPLDITSPLLLSLPVRARTVGQLVKTHPYCRDRAIAIREPHPVCTLPRVGDPARAQHGRDGKGASHAGTLQTTTPTPISAGSEAGSTRVGGCTLRSNASVGTVASVASVN